MRLMLWNIQFFRKSTLNDPSGDTPDKKRLNLQASVLRREHLLSTIQVIDPRILVVLETRSAPGETGSLIRGSGLNASSILLEMLRQQLNSDWYLVPPLKLVGVVAVENEKAYTEGISVYFRNDELRFTGPYIWPKLPDNRDRKKTALPPDQAPPGGAGPYPPEYEGMLPDSNFSAGQWSFFMTAGGQRRRILFPDDRHRSPFLCQFRRRDTPERLYTVAALHTSPDGTQVQAAVIFLDDYMDKPEQRDDPDEVVVIPGDFNTDTEAMGGHVRDIARQIGFRESIPFSDENPTMLQRPSLATAVPAESYLGRHCLDNILTRYGARAGRPGPAYIVNRVAGVQGLCPTGMHTSLDQYPLIARLLGEEKANEEFRGPDNYSKIAAPSGVSDHMALVIEL